MTELKHFEAYEAGQVFDCGARVVSEAEAIAFASAYDPQPFHLDKAAAIATPLAGLALSGWQTAGVVMRQTVEHEIGRAASNGGPGVDKLVWRRPVRPDAPITVQMSVLRTRVSNSRPELGFVHFEATAAQDGREVCRAEFPAMVSREGRHGAPKRIADRTQPDPSAPLAEARPLDALDFTDAENAPLGVVFHLGETMFGEPDIMAFAREYDPQLVHLDPEAAARGVFGGLSASGWDVCARFMKCFVNATQRAAAAADASKADAILRRFGPALGVEALKWRLPALVGDTFKYFAKPVAIEEMPRPQDDWVVLIVENGAVNQFGALVFSMTSRLMARRRSA